MNASNYPPGVTGNESQIAGESFHPCHPDECPYLGVRRGEISMDRPFQRCERCGERVIQNVGRILNRPPSFYTSILRKHCEGIFGRVKWEVRSAPVDVEDWDGTAWNLRDLASKGKPGKRYRADAYKPGGELPVATYEILMPYPHHSVGVVFREVISQKDGLTVFDFVEIW